MFWTMTFCSAAALICEYHTRLFRSILLCCTRDALCWLTHFCCSCKFLLIKYSSRIIIFCDPFRWLVGVRKAIHTQLKLMRPNANALFFFFIIKIGLSKFSSFSYWLLTTHVNWYLWQNTFSDVVCCHTDGHCGVVCSGRAQRLHETWTWSHNMWHAIFKCTVSTRIVGRWRNRFPDGVESMSSSQQCLHPTLIQPLLHQSCSWTWTCNQYSYLSFFAKGLTGLADSIVRRHPKFISPLRTDSIYEYLINWRKKCHVHEAFRIESTWPSWVYNYLVRKFCT